MTVHSEEFKREEEPWRTGRELLEKLQTEEPGNYPEGLLRTVQRRLKGWRTEQARALVFNGIPSSPNEGTAAASVVVGVKQAMAMPDNVQ